MKRAAATVAILLVLVLLAGCVTPRQDASVLSSSAAASTASTAATSSTRSGAAQAPRDAAGRGACPGHWHNGFDVYVPQDGAPGRLDFRVQYPGTTDFYYEWGSPKEHRAGGMRLAAHAHMSGAEGSGSTNQLHYEHAGVCVPLAAALAALDIHLRPDGLTLSGGHVFGRSNRTLREEGAQRLRTWTQDLEGNWTERGFAYANATQVKDGESFLVAFGDFTPEQVRQMQDGVQPALGRDKLLAKLRESQGTSTSTSGPASTTGGPPTDSGPLSRPQPL